MTLLDAARQGDERAFGELVAPHRRELEAYCYRMLGSAPDAEDVVQETLLAAWRGLAGFEGRSSIRTWLYRIASRAVLRRSEQRARLLSQERHPPLDQWEDLGAAVEDAGWVGPWIGGDPEDIASRRETLGLAYVAALQHLPPNQRAVLILRDVLAFSAVETARLLDTSVASVTSALQRARDTLDRRRPIATAGVPGEHRAVVDRFVTAMEARDLDALVSVLAEDVQFTMPPLPAWFDGREAVAGFFEHRVFETPWRQVRMADVSGCPALLGYQEQHGVLRASALQVLHVDAEQKISWIASFLDPALLARLPHPEILPRDR
ncbi:RNA polymerase subunit sigma-70 [Lysobacter korlensis]|uniref:RNA polymerase sigma factor n=1 Tax=Lysobacter korlensis TaxID=553636 RepID=A0ABV6RY69_9GAMM